MTHIFGYYSGKHATISEKVITSAAAVLWASPLKPLKPLNKQTKQVCTSNGGGGGGGKKKNKQNTGAK
jgi:hypothetical protein